MKYLLFVFFALYSALTYSQSLDVISFEKVVSGDTILEWANENTPMIIDFTVKNKSSLSKSIRMRRKEKSIINGTQNGYCWAGSCYSWPVEDLAPGNIKIEAGQMAEFNLTADYDPRGHLGTSTIIYVFFVDGQPNDSTYVIVNYNASPTGIVNENLLIENGISEAFPNPSNTLTTLNYSLKNEFQKGKVLFYDMLGSKVKELELNSKQGALTIPTNEFISGLYFYSFIVDGNTVSTKKLIVSH